MVGWADEGVEVCEVLGVGVVEVAVVEPYLSGEDVAPGLGFFFPVGVGDVSSGEAEFAVVELFNEAYVKKGVIESVVSDINFGFPGPDIVVLYAGAESGDVGESDFAVEGAESGPHFVMIDARAQPEALGYGYVCCGEGSDCDGPSGEAVSDAVAVVDQHRNESACEAGCQG